MATFRYPKRGDYVDQQENKPVNMEEDDNSTDSDTSQNSDSDDTMETMSQHSEENESIPEPGLKTLYNYLKTPDVTVDKLVEMIHILNPHANDSIPSDESDEEEDDEEAIPDQVLDVIQ